MARMTADEWAAELDRERRDLKLSQYADGEARVMDQRSWRRELAARRERIVLKEILEMEARAREEAEAELAECYRGDAA
jgi:hypothetical protein